MSATRPLFVCLLLVSFCARAFEPGSNYLHEPRLERLSNSTNLVEAAFVKEHDLRLYFSSPNTSNQQERLMFKAGWKRPRVAAQGLAYMTANLEAVKKPSSVPDSKSRWRQARVLSAEESTRRLRAAAGTLVPAQPGHGIYFRHAVGDAVLVRESSGAVRTQEGGDTPAGVQIDRRYARQEIAVAAAEALRSDLRSAYPSERVFLLPIGHGRTYRLVLLDFEKRQIVVFFLPLAEDDPRRARWNGLGLSRLASFLLIDHAWAFAKNPLSSAARTVHQWSQWPTTLLAPRLSDKGAAPPLTNGPGMNLADWETWLDHNTGTRREQGSLHLIIDGDKFYPLLDRRLAEARQKICIHVCIFDSDDVAVDVADLLKQRSTNGVKVQVVFDRLMSYGAAKSLPFTPMRDGFIPPKSIATYLRAGSKIDVRPQPNPGVTCDHSKIFVIDDHRAFIGGMNIGREYRYEWHDLMAELEGPIVASLQQEFNKKWGQVGIWGDLGLAAACLRATNQTVTATNKDWIELRRLYTKTFDHQLRMAERAAIDRASNYIFLENPYLFEKAIVVALVRARLRGVDVRVVMPAENDLGPGHQSNLVVANYLLKHGVRVYFYPGMSHVKAMMADGWACFGSGNFDALSLRLNREADIATSDPAFAQRFRTDFFEADFAASHELKSPITVDWSDELVDTLLSMF